MNKLSKAQLLATSAIIGLSVLNLAPAAQAQAAFGVHNDQPELLEVTIVEGETVEGDDIGIYADNGPVEVENDGTVRGNGQSFGSDQMRPSGGIVIAQPNSTVNNRGEISGAANGVTTGYFFGEDANGNPLPSQALAENTSVANSGLIRGEAGTGVALIGGGAVVNSGTIQALTGDPALGAQAIGAIVAEFPEATRSDVTGVGSISNTEDGLIEGQLYGVLLGGGGTIDNAGTIRSTGAPASGVNPFGVILTANAQQSGRIATLDNSGRIEGFLGVLANASLASATIDNSGVIAAQTTAVFGGSTGDLIVNNAESGEITSGGFVAINSSNGTLTLDNAGLVRSDGNSAVNILTPDAQITNSGTIQGNIHGIVTGPSQLPGDTAPVHRAVGTDIVNSGTIIGTNNDAVRLVGGGTVINSGTIQGVNSSPGGTDGVSMFVFEGQDLAEYEASVTNTADGQILGDRSGVALSSGGTVDNAGDIIGNGAGVLIQNGEDGVDGTITNSGLIQGNLAEAVVVFGRIDTFTLTNGGEILGLGSDGVYVNTYDAGQALIDNAEGGEIAGAGSGVHVELGQLTLTNAGTIRGDGGNLGFDAPPDAGVTVSGDANTIINSGTISGTRLGITTANYFNPEASQLEGRATGTTVVNSGTITGDNDDGVRLIGGGSVTNSGTISGNVEEFADGISMFAYTDQANEDYGALVTNQAEGEIAGQRFGVILSGGGEVINDGGITGVAGGIFIQGTALNTDPGEDRSGLSARVVNAGTITGTGDFGGSAGDGYGVGFGSDMTTATLENSGTISSEFGVGVSHGSLADLAITNAAGGVITGATSGIYGAAGGTLMLTNAGTIRGEGTYDGFDDVPDAGVTIGTADSSVVNSGTISGAGSGITTVYLFDEELGELVFLAAGTTVENSGTIAGESNDGVRLIGGGSVANSGTIAGTGAPGADGVSMFRFEGQAASDYAASVTNRATGTIEGDRLGVILSGGGSIDNAGAIEGALGGVVIQSQFDGEDAGLTGTLVNSGTIASESDAGAQFNAGLAAVTVTNSGTISGATLGLGHGTTGTLSLTNSGTISGGATGVESNAGGAVTVVNSGTIAGGTGAAFTSVTQTALDNAGVLRGGGGVAVALGAFDDSVILRTGSDITGAVDAGDGADSLTLAGDVLELTEAQELGASLGFESLSVASGYWSTTGPVGAFGSVTIAQGGALQVNEVDLGEDGLTSPIATSAVTTNGLLVLNFSENDAVSALDALTIDGTGGVELIGEAVFTVDTDTLAYTGGTTVSNGGMILTGTLAGDVTTAGDGFFQLGAGGTEGAFAGDIVNDGRFVFNRSDDYDFLGAFSGSGVLDKFGAGVLTFMGDYAFEGVTNIMGGAVRIGGTIDPETDFNLEDGGTLDITGKDQTIGGLEGGQEATVALGEQTLTIEQEENTEFAGVIEGMGGIVKDGEGILNLTGDSTYTGPTDVNSGTLAVNGSIVSSVTVNAGGTLGGNGTVGDTTLAGGGTLAPGNSIGRLTVNGDLNFAAGSIYEVEVNAAGEGDRVDATGEVTIADTASVAVLAEDGDYAPRTDYVIVTGAEGVTGAFGSVTTDLAFLDPLLRYGADAVTLSLYRNDIAFADVAVNPNQAGVAGAVQALGIDNPLFEAVLVQNAATARSTFGDLSGEVLASTITGLTDDSRHLRNALLGMAAPDETGMFVWGSAFGGWGEFDGSARNFGMETDHKGLVAGVGFGGEGFAAAVSGGLGSSDFDLDGRRDAAEAESKYLAAHATVSAPGGFHGAAGISYAWHDVETTRGISGAPLAQTLASDRDANTLQVFGELGYEVMAGSIAVTPFARLAHVRTESDAFTETGGTAALAVSEAEQKTTFLSLGARARFNAEGEGFRPYLSAAWNHAFGDRTALIGARFAAGGPNFAVRGLAIPENSAELEAGFDYASGAFSVGAAYSGTLASDRTSHGARVTAKVAF